MESTIYNISYYLYQLSACKLGVILMLQELYMTTFAYVKMVIINHSTQVFSERWERPLIHMSP